MTVCSRIPGFAEAIYFGDDVEACLALGVGAFVKKPYSFEHLSKVTQEVLKSS